tara:strand:- start:56 stop:1552 length:1497 start_codon:yes stop_codon:yes gene_type:complete
MTNIIFGPPGTGKTWTLLEEVENFIKQGVDPSKIGFFTFSRNATQEVHDRMYSKFQLTKKELPHFRTLHSLGFTQLGYSREKVMKDAHYKEIGKTCGIELTYAIWDEDNGGVFSSDSPFLSLIELAKARNITTEQQFNLDEHNQDLDITTLKRLEKEILNYKRDRGTVDWNDMINEFVKSKLCPKLKVAFIDEAQDLSIMQWKVVEKIRDNCEILYIAGDDDQCIYKWRGADVTSFLNFPGDRRTLQQSYRVPKKIFDVANKIISRIPNNKRVKKNWMPTEDEGSVDYHYDLEEIDISKGKWLILARDRWKLDEYEAYFKDNNIYFERKGFEDRYKEKYKSIDLWENKLKKGEPLTFEECHTIKKKMTNESWENKMFKAMVKDGLYDINTLKNKYGLKTEAPWQSAFTRMGESDTKKITELLNRGEDLKNGARIKLSTVHGVKGNERDNVVLSLSLTKTTFESYEKNPDDEHRTMYTGVTRSKKSLHIIYPNKRGYDL